jgi:hypothetical protein
MTASAASRASRRWANLSLAAGGLWLVLSLTPFFLTTLLGLPFATLAFVGGWLGRRSADAGATRRSHWGLGLGCAGCLWQMVYYALLAGVLVAGLPSLIDYLQKTLTP